MSAGSRPAGRPRLLLVAGMHRSGTSMFARFLDASGIPMGERLHVDLRTNPYGHYEDEDFLLLQRTEIARWTGGEDYLVDRSAPPGPAFVERSRELLDARLRTHGDRLWGWKDPRTTLFLDHWLGLEPGLHVAALVRRPREVLDSLSRRLRARLRPRLKERILRSYVHHNRVLLAFARRVPRQVTVLPLEGLVRDPEQNLERLSAALGRELDPELLRARFDGRVLGRSRRTTVLLHRRSLAEAEAVRAALLELAAPGR